MTHQGPIPPRVIAVLAAAVLAISSAAVLVRLVDEAAPVTVAFWRMAAASVLLAPAMRWVARRDALRLALAGLFLAGHFAAWFTSLEHTSVLRSTVLVCTSPVWVGLIEWVVQRKRPATRYWVGLAIALIGIGIMSTRSPAGEVSLLGDGLAALGGLFAGIYFAIGRDLRQRLGVGTTMAFATAAAAVALLPIAGVAGASLWPLSWWDIGAIAALCAGPQLIGHNGFSYALRHVPASTVSAVTLLEPVGAAVLAALVLAELPGGVEAAGGAVIVVGVGVALFSR